MQKRKRIIGIFYNAMVHTLYILAVVLKEPIYQQPI